MRKTSSCSTCASARPSRPATSQAPATSPAGSWNCEWIRSCPTQQPGCLPIASTEKSPRLRPRRFGPSATCGPSQWTEAWTPGYGPTIRSRERDPAIVGDEASAPCTADDRGAAPRARSRDRTSERKPEMSEVPAMAVGGCGASAYATSRATCLSTSPPTSTCDVLSSASRGSERENRPSILGCEQGEHIPLVGSDPSFEHVQVHACNRIWTTGFDDPQPAPHGIPGRGHEATEGGREPPLELRRSQFDRALPDLRRREEQLGSRTGKLRLRLFAVDGLPVAEAHRATASRPLAEATVHARRPAWCPRSGPPERSACPPGAKGPPRT